MAAGRIFALEMAFYVTAESISGVGGGLMFDRLHLTTLQVSGVMFVISMISTVLFPPPPSPPVHAHAFPHATHLVCLSIRPVLLGSGTDNTSPFGFYTDTLAYSDLLIPTWCAASVLVHLIRCMLVNTNK